MSADGSFDHCPRYGEPMKAGFAARAATLSFIEPEKFRRFAFIDEDLAQTGLLRKLLPWKGEYYRAYLCRSCSLYVVDYSHTLSRREADEAAHAIDAGADT